MDTPVITAIDPAKPDNAGDREVELAHQHGQSQTESHQAQRGEQLHHAVDRCRR